MERTTDSIVLQNFLDEDYYNILKEGLYSSKINWSYVDHSVQIPEGEDKRKLLFTDASVFRYLMVYGDELRVSKENFNLIQPFLGKLSDYFNHRKLFIRRIAANLLPRNIELIGKYNYPHIDQDYTDYQKEAYDLYTGIYYFEDGCADTLLIDNTDHISVIGRIKPSKNTFVLLDAHQWHSAPCSGEEKKRVVINFNIMVEKHADENVTIYSE